MESVEENSEGNNQLMAVIYDDIIRFQKRLLEIDAIFEIILLMLTPHYNF